MIQDSNLMIKDLNRAKFQSAYIPDAESVEAIYTLHTRECICLRIEIDENVLSGSLINFEVLQNLQRSFVLVHNSYDGAHLNLDLLSLASPCMLTLKMTVGTPIITTPLQCLLSLCFLMLSWMKSCLMW